jgi:hypothetical protein
LETVHCRTLVMRVHDGAEGLVFVGGLKLSLQHVVVCRYSRVRAVLQRLERVERDFGPHGVQTTQ